MKLIICTDTRLGYSFNERRQSSDRVVHQHMADLLLEYDAPVYMNNYSGRSISRNRLTFCFLLLSFLHSY